MDTPIQPYHEQRPWGNFIKFTQNTASTVKIITIKAGNALSLQKHTARSEFWHIISGTGVVTIGTSTSPLTAGAEYTVPPHTLHRIEAETDTCFLEIALGTFDENDIVRTEDKYGRV